jgi:hypothetical protein
MMVGAAPALTAVIPPPPAAWLDSSSPRDQRRWDERSAPWSWDVFRLIGQFLGGAGEEGDEVAGWLKDWGALRLPWWLSRNPGSEPYIAATQ